MSKQQQVGPRLGTVVSMMCCLTQLGVCCVMLSFVATNLLAVAPCEVRAHLLTHHTGGGGGEGSSSYDSGGEGSYGGVYGYGGGGGDSGMAEAVVVGGDSTTLEIVHESACFGLRLLPAKRVFIALVLPVFIALSWLPSINALAPLAKVANFFMLM
jgi:hypothetical protein